MIDRLVGPAGASTIAKKASIFTMRRREGETQCPTFVRHLYPTIQSILAPARKILCWPGLRSARILRLAHQCFRMCLPCVPIYDASAPYPDCSLLHSSANHRLQPNWRDGRSLALLVYALDVVVLYAL